MVMRLPPSTKISDRARFLLSSEGHSPSVKRATAYRYGSTTIITARFVGKGNMFLYRIKSSRLWLLFFCSRMTWRMLIWRLPYVMQRRGHVAAQPRRLGRKSWLICRIHIKLALTDLPLLRLSWTLLEQSCRFWKEEKISRHKPAYIVNKYCFIRLFVL